MLPGKGIAAISTVLLLLAAAAAAALQPGEAYRDIMQRKELRVAVSIDYPPLNFNAGENGDYQPDDQCQK